MNRLGRLFAMVLSRTGQDTSQGLKVVLCDDDAQFEKEKQKMRRHNYNLPLARKNVLAYYFSSCRKAVISPQAQKDRETFDTIVLHEIFHHLFAHKFKRSQVNELRASVTANKDEIAAALLSLGMSVPWSIEERLAYLFPYAIRLRVPYSKREVKKLARKVMSPILRERE